MAARSRVDIEISKKTISEISSLSLALAAGFDEKRLDKALQAASNATAKAMVKPVKAAAPTRKSRSDGGSGNRIRRAVWAQPVMRDKPGAYVGIRPGRTREDIKGAYYRWMVTSGTSRVPYEIRPKRGKVLRFFGSDGTPVFAKSVTRKAAVPGRPFVTDAVSKNAQLALDTFSMTLTAIIQNGIPKKGRIKLPKLK